MEAEVEKDAVSRPSPLIRQHALQQPTESSQLLPEPDAPLHRWPYNEPP